jgi:hypothetical protein
MNVAEIVTARLIGTVFVERGLLSESQIRVALEIQRETGQQLGQVLVERFGVSRQELASVVAEQWADIGRSAPSDADAAANESWRRLGDIFVERGFVTPEQLEQALERQRETGERVGEALVAQGSISKFELAGALAEQMSALGPAEPGSEPVEATVVPLPPRVEEPQPGLEAEGQPDPVPVPVIEAATDVDDESRPEPAWPRPVTLPTSLALAEPPPSYGWVAFASTAIGYRIVQLAGPIPDIGATVDVTDMGELVVLRLGRSPLPQDDRTCVFLEQLVHPEIALAG